MRTRHNHQFGFTLVEMIVVMVITGIIGGMVAIFIKAPIQGYVDSSRRAALTDIADTAVRRMARDVRTAVPNSIRTGLCGVPCVEYLPTKDGGRYRALQTAGGAGNVLDFGVADGSFDVIGSAINIATNDYIVIGSTESSGNPPYIQTNAGILRLYTSFAGGLMTMNNTKLPVWAELSSQRFDVVDGAQQAVTYACEGTLITRDASGNGQAKLVKHWKYGFNPGQIAPGGLTAILADKVSDCTIVYDVTSQRLGLLAIQLTLTSGNESVSLYNEIHVNNVP